MRPLSKAGFTLIELLITIVILSIVLVLAVPGYKVWVQNAQIRTASDAILNGLQYARAEAVRRNVLVEFSLNSGTGWTIKAGSETLQSRNAGDGSKNVITTVNNSATKVTFNGLGRVSANADSSASITQIDIKVPDAILAAADRRDLRILLADGQARLCDPQVSATGDPRKC